MDTVVISWVRGSTSHYGFVLSQPDGSAAVYAAAEMRITVGGSDLRLPARPQMLRMRPDAPGDDPGWVVDLTPDTIGHLRGDVFRVRFWRLDHAGEWAAVQEPFDRMLKIKGVC